MYSIAISKVLTLTNTQADALFSIRRNFRVRAYCTPGASPTHTLMYIRLDSLYKQKLSSTQPYMVMTERLAKTYNSGDSLVVTHLTTNPPVSCLIKAERTGSHAFKILWSYVEEELFGGAYSVGV
jgi:hypothetical protein